jgi:hypothetical protein
VLDKEVLQVSAMQYSADSKRLLVAGAGIFRVYDIDDGTLLHHYKHSGANLMNMVWSPDEKLVMGNAARGRANVIRVIDIESGNEVCSLSVGQQPQLMIFLGSGQLALVQIGSYLNLVDLRLRKTLVQHKVEGGKCRAAPDYTGRTFFVVSEAKRVEGHPPTYRCEVVIYGRRP